MSPTPDNLPTRDPDWDQLIAASLAAKLLGIDDGAMRRKCRNWSRVGLAIKSKGPDGGHKQWWVDRSVDPRLQQGRVGTRAVSLKHVQRETLEAFRSALTREARAAEEAFLAKIADLGGNA